MKSVKCALLPRIGRSVQISTLALVIGLGGALGPDLFGNPSGIAHAQGQGAGGQGGGGQGGGGAGQGGPGEDSEGKGPRAGSGGSAGGKPVWAQEGLPEVELGRLSVARSPDHVLDRAYEEALLALSPEVLAFYNQSLSDMIYDLSINWDTITIIDSPLQNLSLFRDALDGVSVLSSLGVTTSADTLLSVFIGVASDKTLPVTTDTVIAVSTILGMPLSEAQSEAIAVDADAVRIAVLAGHG